MAQTRLRPPDPMRSVHVETAAFVDMSGPDGPRLPQLPALDGLRGLAVAAVVAYHAGFGVMVGGYLGVSTFFTLSGFLITSLLINESRRTGAVELRSFWTRRFRRLLPASLVTLALVATLFAWLVATPSQLSSLRGDLLASLFDVANWRFILQGSTYGDLFSAPSPVLHFWSLSIEEQFYVLFPLALLGLWRITRGRRELLGIAFIVLAAASATLPLWVEMSRDRVYFGTDTRAAELLTGAALAVLLSYRPVRRLIALRYRWRVTLLGVAAAFAGLQVYWWWTLPQSSEWLYNGGFAVYSLMTCTIIAAAALPTGAFRNALSARSLRWLGTRSFAIYLVHWPIFLAVRQLLPEWGRPAQAALAVSSSLALAELSFHLLERPIRLGRWPERASFARAAAIAMTCVALLAFFALPSAGADDEIDFDEALSDFNDRPAQQVPVTTTVPTPEPQPPASARVATFGDSTALLMALGMAENSRVDPRLIDVGGDVSLGCGVSRFEELRLEEDMTRSQECRSWPPRWAEVVSTLQPDIAQLATGAWEVPDARIPGTTEFAAIGDPEVDAFIRSELDLAIDTLSAEGAMVLLVKWPAFGDWADDGQPEAISRQTDPARMAALHQMMDDAAAARPESVRVLDVGAFLGPERLADRDLRLDGLHIEEAQMQQLYAEGLAEVVYDIYADWWTEERSGAETGPR